MTHPFWLRYLDVGHRLAMESPDFFPTAVCMLETLADGKALGQLIHDALAIEPVVGDPAESEVA